LTGASPSSITPESYEAQIEDAIRFAGREHDFYLAAKARALLDLVDRRLRDGAPIRALDVGCGDGRLDAMLEPLEELHGVDASPTMVAAATEAVPRGRFQVADGQHLPFADGVYDLTLTVCALHHVPPAERPAYMRELARVTRKGGLVVVFEHNPLNPLTRLVVRRIPFDEGVVLVGRRDLHRLARAAGLSVDETRYILFFPWSRGPLPQIEHRLARLPAGAQYFVAARA
jgi:SAM-dependent methyltransferase